MKVYQLNEIKNACTQNKYKMGVVLDPSGKKCIPSPKVNTKVETWLEQTVRPYLRRNSIATGIYTIQLYNDAAKRTQPEIYPIQVGNIPGTENASNVTVVMNQPGTQQLSENEKVLTYEGAIDIKTQIVRLEMENAQLKKRLEELENEEEEEEEEFLEDPAPAQPHWSESLIQGAVATIQAILDDRKAQRELHWATLHAQHPNLKPPVTQPQAQPQQQKLTPEQEQAIIQKSDQYFKHLEQTNPEVYAQIYNLMVSGDQSKPEQFYVELQKQHPEVYAELLQHLNAA